MGKILYDNYKLIQQRNGKGCPAWETLGTYDQLIWIELGDFVSSFLKGLIELKVELP